MDALVEISGKAGCSHAQRLQLRSDVVGVMVGPQYATQIVKTLHCYLDATLLYRAVSMPQASSSRLSRRFRPARRQETSPDASRSRGTLAILPGEVYFRVQGPPHRSTGAPRARWARPELGKDPDVTPDQHCEEWEGLLRGRAARRGAGPSSTHTTG